MLHPDRTELDLGLFVQLASDSVTAGKNVSAVAFLYSWGL